MFRHIIKQIKLIVLLTVIVMLINPTGIYAADADSKALFSVSDDTNIKLYVQGVSEDDNSSFQIGNTPTATPESYSINDDDYPVRTLIMLDNSISIPKEAQQIIGDSIKAIINNHGNNEEFRLATFSENIEYLTDAYSSDYTALINVADSITYYDQETYLTDVLYDVINDYNSENYKGYTRIIVFSDGVDNKPIGITREELNKLLEDSTYPLYTFGVKTKNNSEQLKNMFALSRLTKCESGIIGEYSSSDISDITKQDNNIIVFKALIPEEAKVGGRQNVKLTLSDGREFIASGNMPLGIKTNTDTKDSEKTVDSKETEKSKDTEASTVKTDTENVAKDTNMESGIFIPVIVIVVLLFIIAVIVFLVIKNVKKKNTEISEPAQQELNEGPTVIINAENRTVDGGTVLLMPNDSETISGYTLTLSDEAEPVRSFRCDLVDEISIGRLPDNNIVINDDSAVHGHNSYISAENGVFYIKDIDQKKNQNHSKVNGIELKPGIKQLIVNDSRITIGRHTYVIGIRENR